MHILLAQSLHQLLPRLASRVAQPQPTLFAKEHVIVPADATRDWLAAELSDRLNIWCNHAVYTPTRMLERFGGPRVSAPGAWRILSALHHCQSRPGFEAPARYLAADNSGLRGIQLATRISTLFARYCRFRPALIRDWTAGIPATASDWQSELWREVAGEDRDNDPVAAVGGFIEGLSAATLPARISVFGVWHLAPLELQLLRAVAAHTDIAVFAIDESPLAAALAGETIERLEVKPLPTSMLARLQRKLPPGDCDHSLRIHSCHGRQREVEILRDSLLGLFSADKTLQPEDVLVLTPQVNEYVPLIASVFGADSDVSQTSGSRARIPVCFADHASAVDEPALAAFRRLLRLVLSRHPLSAVVEFLDTAPVRAQFGISEPTLDLVHTWLDDARVRWAEDAEARVRFDNPALPHHTWRWGLDRLLLGYAMEGDEKYLFDDILPIGDIAGPEAQHLGALCEFCETLFTQLSRLEQPHPISEWQTMLLEAYDALISGRDIWAASRTTLLSVLRDLEGDNVVSVGAVAHWLEERLDLVSSRGRFFGGGVTIASLRHGRAIPARVIALLGLDHDRFPRNPASFDFDLLQGEPEPGDLSDRHEDRLAFRGALLAATDHLHLSFVGQGNRDNQPRPPSVLIAEILDQMNPEARAEVLIEHPMQPFSPHSFRDGRVTAFSSGWHAAASALVAGETVAAPFFPSPLEPESEDNVIGLVPLVRFFKNPVKELLRMRLDLHYESEEEQVPDREPFDLSYLERWHVGETLLRALLTDQDPEQLWPVMRASGNLPMGAPGRVAFDGFLKTATAIAAEAETLGAGPLLTDIDVDLELGSHRLVGRLDGVRENGLLYVSYSKLNAGRTLSGWIKHLIARVSELQPASTWVVGRDKQQTAAVLRWPEISNPSQHLESFIGFYLRGMTDPLPFMPNTSCAYAQAYLKDGERSVARRKAATAWRGSASRGPIVPGDGDNPAVAKVFDTTILESDEFHQIALEIFEPLLTAESTEEPAR